MARPRTIIVAQSGGATAVINGSLRGVIEEAQRHRDVFGKVLGARHGVEGLLTEALVRLDTQPREELELLSTTPGAGAIGTCRYKLLPDDEEDYERLVAVCRAHEVGWLFYIGGNDSMDTAMRVSRLAQARGHDLAAVGIPKTIDNDLGDRAMTEVDHTPGYGSTARHWALQVITADEENRGARTSDPVLVLQAMGRRIGFIPAAARLADPDRALPLLLFLPEAGWSLEDITEHIGAMVARRGRAIVVVSEGLDIGEVGVSRDSFGHAQFSSSKLTVAARLVNHLNSVGLPARGSARSDVPGTHQRRDVLTMSPVDAREAYEVARHAVARAAMGARGFMATIRRASEGPYVASFGEIPLDTVGGKERAVPTPWLMPGRADVTDGFVDYAMPLIGDAPLAIPLDAKGLPRLARLRDHVVEPRLGPYIPVGWRRQ